ncbi:hypothetical protein ACOSQ3_021164 [Xanthoceras sorbifolium]
MPKTRSGRSYNSMEQASHNPSSSNPPNEPIQTPINIQQQLDQLSQTLGTILHRGGNDVGKGYRAPRQRDGIGDSEDDWEISLGGGRRRAQQVAPMQFCRPYVRQEPLDELTKRMKVKGPARAWWSSVEEQLRKTHQAPIIDWEEMKERLESKYLPINYDQLIYEDMLQWKQGPKASIDQYTERFHKLSVRSKAIETETQSLARYLNGLKNEIRRDMLTARVYSVEEAYQLALQLERQTNGRHQMHYQPTEFVSTRTISTSNQKNVDETMKGAATGNVRGKAKLVGEGPQCYKCKGFGHFAVVCPSRDKRVAYVCEKELIVEEEAEPISIHNVQETQELEAEEVLQATDLPICVINRVLIGRKQLLEPEFNDWKRINIFHTRVAHGNKALNVIIDNGSGMNVVCKEVVERLGLPQQPHPTPYRVS